MLELGCLIVLIIITNLCVKYNFNQKPNHGNTAAYFVPVV